MTTPSRTLQQPAGVAGAAPRVLIVDDEPLAKVFARTLEAADYDVRWARDGAGAKRALQSETLDVIGSDGYFLGRPGKGFPLVAPDAWEAQPS